MGSCCRGRSRLTAGLRLTKTAPGVPTALRSPQVRGTSRASGRAPFDPRWLDGQRELNVPHVLSDSGYIGRGDVRALAAVLDQAVAAGHDVTAVLPMHTNWLRGDLATLISEVSVRRVPIALVLEHQKDPLQACWETVRGLVALIRQVPAVGLLCSDVSALGALAFGASWAAQWESARASVICTRPTVASVRPHGMQSALVDPALALIKVGKIAAASHLQARSNRVWACYCSVCHGRTLDWLLSATAEQANQHTFELLLDRRDGLMSLPGPLREQSWRAKCASAAFQYEALALVGVAWDVPRFLLNWQAV